MVWFGTWPDLVGELTPQTLSTGDVNIGPRETCSTGRDATLPSDHGARGGGGGSTLCSVTGAPSIAFGGRGGAGARGPNFNPAEGASASARHAGGVRPRAVVVRGLAVGPYTNCYSLTRLTVLPPNPPPIASVVGWRRHSPNFNPARDTLRGPGRGGW